MNDGILILDVNITGTVGSAKDQKVERQINILLDREVKNRISLEDKIYEMPIIYGRSEKGAIVELELSLDNDDLYDDGFYETVADSNGDWVINLKLNKPSIGDIPKFREINDILNIKLTTIDKANNINIKNLSAEVILSRYSISNGKIIEGKTGSKEMSVKIFREGDLSTIGSIFWEIDEELSTAKRTTDLYNDFDGYLSGKLIFEIGESYKEFKVEISGDYYKEHNDNIVIKLSEPENGEIEDELSISEILELDTKNIGHIF